MAATTPDEFFCARSNLLITGSLLIWAFTQHHLILVACFLANRVWCTGREFPIFFQVFLFKDNNKEKEKLKFSMSEKAKGIWRNLTLCCDVSRSILKKTWEIFCGLLTIPEVYLPQSEPPVIQIFVNSVKRLSKLQVSSFHVFIIFLF